MCKNQDPYYISTKWRPKLYPPQPQPGTCHQLGVDRSLKTHPDQPKLTYPCKSAKIWPSTLQDKPELLDSGTFWFELSFQEFKPLSRVNMDPVRFELWCWVQPNPFNAALNLIWWLIGGFGWPKESKFFQTHQTNRLLKKRKEKQSLPNSKPASVE